MTIRQKNIDIYKGIGILTVILGHINLLGKGFDLYIHAFHMPMFFFISGYLFKTRKFSDFISRKINSLIIPYLTYGVFNLIICHTVLNNFNLLNYLKSFLWINNVPSIPITGALWFLTCLFFINLIFYCLLKFEKLYLLELLIILLICCEIFFKIKLPYSIDSGIYMLPIFYAGYKFKNLRLNVSKIQLLSIFIITIFTIFLNNMVNVRINNYSNIFLFYFNAILMSILIFYLSKSIIKINCLKSFLNYLGNNSLIYMCIHQSILFLLLKNGVNNKIILFIIILLLISIYITIVRRLQRIISNSFKKGNNTHR